MSHTLCLSARNPGLFLDWWEAHRERRDAAVHHFIWQVDQAPDWETLVQAITERFDTEGERLIRQLQPHWWGLIPGWHRLALEDERLILQLAIAPASDALSGATGGIRRIHLGSDFARTAELPDPGHLASALSGLSRHGSQLHCDCSQALPEVWSAAWAHAMRSKGWIALDEPHSYLYDPHWISKESQSGLSPSTAVVIGSGLSGAASAWSLARRGWQVTVLDAGPAPAAGASGLPVGLVVPHTSADDTRISQVSRAGVRCMLHRADALLEHGQQWSGGGVLEHCVDGESKLARAWTAADRPKALQPASEWAHPASPAEVAEAKLPEGTTAVRHPCAAWIKPPALVHALLRQPGIHFQGNSRVVSLKRSDAGRWQALDDSGAVLAEADIVVMAAAFQSSALLQRLASATGQSSASDSTFGIPFKPLRGQIAWGWQDEVIDQAALPPRPVNGKGSMAAHIPYAIGAREGYMWITGSTFNRGDTDPGPREKDMGEILAKLQILHPKAAAALTPAFAEGRAHAWAGVRTTLPDRLPVVGPLAVAGLEGIYLCSGMGARGLALAMLCGEQLAAQVHDEPWPVERKLGQMLSAGRWLARSAAENIRSALSNRTHPLHAR